MVYKTEMITVVGVTGFTAATMASALADMAKVGRDGTIKRIVCTVETGNIRVRVDGSSPTNTMGHLLGVGGVFVVSASDAGAFKALNITAIARFAASYEV